MTVVTSTLMMTTQMAVQLELVREKANKIILIVMGKMAQTIAPLAVCLNLLLMEKFIRIMKFY